MLEKLIAFAFACMVSIGSPVFAQGDTLAGTAQIPSSLETHATELDQDVSNRPSNEWSGYKSNRNGLLEPDKPTAQRENDNSSYDLGVSAKFGTLQVYDHGHNFQKHWAAGVGARLSGGDRFVYTVEPELWKLLANSRHTPTFGATAFATLGYRLNYRGNDFIPYLGLNPGYWYRNLDEKFHVSGQDNQHWRWMAYNFFPVGLRWERSRFFADIGWLVPGPYQSNVHAQLLLPYGTPHLYAGVGVEIGDFRISLRYVKTAFAQPNTDIEIYSVSLEYLIKKRLKNLRSKDGNL